MRARLCHLDLHTAVTKYLRQLSKRKGLFWLKISVGLIHDYIGWELGLFALDMWQGRTLAWGVCDRTKLLTTRPWEREVRGKDKVPIFPSRAHSLYFIRLMSRRCTTSQEWHRLETKPLTHVSLRDIPDPKCNTD